MSLGYKHMMVDRIEVQSLECVANHDCMSPMSDVRLTVQTTRVFASHVMFKTRKFSEPKLVGVCQVATSSRTGKIFRSRAV